MKHPRLVCVACGKQAKVVLHGTSYCTLHAYMGVNKPQIQTTPHSPIEREARKHEVKLVTEATKHVAANRVYVSPYMSTANLTSFGLRFKSGKKHKSLQQQRRSQQRNARRRALRRKRASSKVSNVSP